MTNPKAVAKTKVYRNPARDKQEPAYKPYIPQYQLEGIEPQQFKSARVPAGTLIAKPEPLPLDNPRAPRPLIRQPYAETTTSPIKRGGLIPNVGNNIEQTWSSVDGEIIDDFSYDPQQPMIDNNDFVSEAALGFESGLDARELPTNFISQPVRIEMPPEVRPQVSSETNDTEFLSIVSSLEEDSYLLIVAGNPLCSGPKEEIEEQARQLVFGDHELCENQPIPIEEIIILKKVKVKVGLFLD
jgi:hypothetical protein